MTDPDASFYQAHDAESTAKGLITHALEMEASDIHLNSRSDCVSILVRAGGQLREMARLSHEEGETLMHYLKVAGGLPPVTAGHPVEAHCEIELETGEVAHLRLASMRATQGEKLSLRLLNPERVTHSLDETGLSAEAAAWLRDWSENASGLVIVAGPTGAGKTTTLYALLDELRHRNLNVLSLEDPVEHALDGLTQLELHPELQLDAHEGLRALLRHDPDLVFIGEIRDPDTARVAVEAAQTGHAILTTLHARDVAGVITLLEGYGIPPHEIAATLAGVISQRLVLKTEDETSLITEEDADWLRERGFSVDGLELVDVIPEPDENAIQRRTGVFEWWVPGSEGYDFLLTRPDEHALRDWLRSNGVPGMLEDGVEKLRAGKVPASALRRLEI